MRHERPQTTIETISKETFPTHLNLWVRQQLALDVGRQRASIRDAQHSEPLDEPLTRWRSDLVDPRNLRRNFFPHHIFMTPSYPYATKASRKAHYAKNLIISKSNGTRGRATRLAYRQRN